MKKTLILTESSYYVSDLALTQTLAFQEIYKEKYLYNDPQFEKNKLFDVREYVKIASQMDIVYSQFEASNFAVRNLNVVSYELKKIRKLYFTDDYNLFDFERGDWFGVSAALYYCTHSSYIEFLKSNKALISKNINREKVNRILMMQMSFSDFIDVGGKIEYQWVCNNLKLINENTTLGFGNKKYKEYQNKLFSYRFPNMRIFADKDLIINTSDTNLLYCNIYSYEMEGFIIIFKLKKLGDETFYDIINTPRKGKALIEQTKRIKDIFSDEKVRSQLINQVFTYEHIRKDVINLLDSVLGIKSSYIDYFNFMIYNYLYVGELDPINYKYDKEMINSVMKLLYLIKGKIIPAAAQNSYVHYGVNDILLPLNGIIFISDEQQIILLFREPYIYFFEKPNEDYRLNYFINILKLASLDYDKTFRKDSTVKLDDIASDKLIRKIQNNGTYFLYNKTKVSEILGFKNKIDYYEDSGRFNEEGIQKYINTVINKQAWLGELDSMIFRTRKRKQDEYSGTNKIQKIKNAISKMPCCICKKKASYKCSKCNFFTYCSSDCQQYDWRNGHQIECEKDSFKSL